MRTLILLLIIVITKITLVNYLGTKVITESGGFLANLLTRECGYILVKGNKLPPPPWVNRISPSNSDYWIKEL